MASPNGCRICGLDERGHARRWSKSVGWHQWTPPTQAQIKRRMQDRRTARLTAEPPKYHAATRYTGSAGDPEDEGEALCADCGTPACAQYQRIQTRRAIHLTDPAARGTGSWGGNPNWPF